jgi:DNA-binding HxlR family transcriptional regulator
MKKIITQLHKAFDHRLRLGIMSILMVNDWVDFNTLKDSLDANDGTLASHIKNLEKYEFIEIRKRFIGRKPNTSYRASEKGRLAFSRHLDALEQVLKNSKDKS